MSEFSVNEAPATSKWNQKTIFIGTAAPASPLEGKVWMDTSGADIAVKVRDKGSVNWRTIGIITGEVFKATDAELLDGQEGSYYQNSDNQNAGTLVFARLPSFAKFQIIPAAAFHGYGGATWDQNAAGKKAGWLLDASGEGCSTQVPVPPGVTSVTAKLWMRAGNSANAVIYVRANAIGDDYGTDTGTEDSKNTFGDGTNNVQRVDVSTAFDLAGIIAANKILNIRCELIGAATLQVFALELAWA